MTSCWLTSKSSRMAAWITRVSEAYSVVGLIRIDKIELSRRDRIHVIEAIMRVLKK